MAEESFSVDWEYDDDEQGNVYVHATGTINRGNPGSFYDKNGDPGDAPEGDEVEFDMICCFDENDKSVGFDGAYEEDLIDYVLSQY